MSRIVKHSRPRPTRLYLSWMSLHPHFRKLVVVFAVWPELDIGEVAREGWYGKGERDC